MCPILAATEINSGIHKEQESLTQNTFLLLAGNFSFLLKIYYC